MKEKTLKLKLSKELRKGLKRAAHERSMSVSVYMTALVYEAMAA